MYNISVCACYYIPLFGSGFCLHCGKVVSQVLPAIKTRAVTAAENFVRSLVLRSICASLIIHTHTYTRWPRVYTRLQCIAAAPVFVVVDIVIVAVVVVVIVADGETLDVKKF